MTPGARYTSRKTGRTVTLIERVPAGIHWGEPPNQWRAKYDEGNTTRLLEATIRKDWRPEGDPTLIKGLDEGRARLKAVHRAGIDDDWIEGLGDEPELMFGYRGGDLITFRHNLDHENRRKNRDPLPLLEFLANARTDLTAAYAEIDRLNALLKGRGR